MSLKFFVFNLVLLHFCSLTIHGQSNIGAKESRQSGKTNELRIKIEANRKIKTGEALALNVKVSNNTDREFSMIYSLLDAFAGYIVEIRDTKGNLVLPTKPPDEAKGFDSRTSFVFSPGYKTEFDLLLNDFYKLKPGKYMIEVRLDVIDLKKKEKIIVKSGQIGLNVLQN